MEISPLRRIQVFEHQRIKINQQFKTTIFEARDFEAFTRLPPNKFFSLTHKGVQFKQYVGALQVGTLLVEILPKTDQLEQETQLWSSFLLDMLRYCQLLRYESMSTASLRTLQHSILELYYELLLQEVAALLHQGLYKTHRSVLANRGALKGQIHFAKQIAHNLIHKERFYTTAADLSFQNPFNQTIYAALQLLQRSNLPFELDTLLQQIQLQFPAQSSSTNWQQQPFQYNRQNQHYRKAIQIAQLLLQHQRPDLQQGQDPLIAILFDMNLLFEEYLFRQLQRAAVPSIRLRRQYSVPFWKRRYIRPDILLEYNGKTVVLDTKWKHLPSAKPPMQDIQQAFVYGQYFKAHQTVLIYPKTTPTQSNASSPFLLKNRLPSSNCSIHFVEIIKNGKLNLDIGKDIIQGVAS